MWHVSSFIWNMDFVCGGKGREVFSILLPAKQENKWVWGVINVSFTLLKLIENVSLRRITTSRQTSGAF